MIKNEKVIIAIMTIIFLITFITSVMFGVVFKNMVVASLPIVVFWLFVINHICGAMKEF